MQALVKYSNEIAMKANGIKVRDTELFVLGEIRP